LGTEIPYTPFSCAKSSLAADVGCGMGWVKLIPKKKGRPMIGLPSRRGEKYLFFQFLELYSAVPDFYITIPDLICYWGVPDFGG
jgi:hypothetical protein